MRGRLNKTRSSAIRNSLPKSCILRGRGAFNRVFKQGKRLSGAVVDTRFLFSAGMENPLQVGFAAGKKFGNAPIRNRAKRLMREAFRLNQHELREQLEQTPPGTGLHLIFTIRTGPADFSTVLADISDHLKRITEELKAGKLRPSANFS